jgi:hypothetical protein
MLISVAKVIRKARAATDLHAVPHVLNHDAMIAAVQPGTDQLVRNRDNVVGISRLLHGAMS